MQCITILSNQSIPTYQIQFIIDVSNLFPERSRVDVPVDYVAHRILSVPFKLHFRPSRLFWADEQSRRFNDFRNDYQL